MMYRLICFSFFLLISISVKSQNIVPNSSFEDTTGSYLKNGINYIPASYWSSFGNSPDFYNSGNYDFTGVPGNGFGYQPAHTGKNYCGFYSFLDFAPKHPYREFIGVKLNEPLQTGIRYFINFKVSLSDSSNCGSNNIGALFSNKVYSDSIVAPIKNKAHIVTKKIILEKTKWVSVAGSFVSDSNYNYIIIGNFFDDISTERTILKYLDCTAYYYIDDICVSKDSMLCNNDFDSTLLNDEINIFPNPTLDKIFLESKVKLDPSKFYLFDMLGKCITDQVIITQSPHQHNLIVDVKNLAAAMYIITVVDRNNILHKLKFIKQ